MHTCGRRVCDASISAFNLDIALSCVCRGRWLLGLLIVQSTSSFVLDSYSDLLREHLVVTLFLTMLVGAGGNAGNQSAIKVIRGLVRQFHQILLGYPCPVVATCGTHFHHVERSL